MAQGGEEPGAAAGQHVARRGAAGGDAPGDGALSVSNALHQGGEGAAKGADAQGQCENMLHMDGVTQQGVGDEGDQARDDFGKPRGQCRGVKAEIGREWRGLHPMRDRITFGPLQGIFSRKGKRFFFGKKKQKTFVRLAAGGSGEGGGAKP